MPTFHSPLGLMQRVSKPEKRLDVVALVTVLLLAGTLTLAASRFLYSPGLTVDISAAGTAAGKTKLPALNLPRSKTGALAGIATGSTLTVLSAKSGNIFIFEGRIYSLDENLKKNLAPAAKRSPVLLLKLDKSIDAQTVFTLCEYATAAGFEKVQLAGESAAPAK